MTGQLSRFKQLKNRIIKTPGCSRADAVTLAWAEETLEAALSVSPVGGFTVGEDGSLTIHSEPVIVTANDGSVPHVELDEFGSPVEGASLTVVSDDLLVEPIQISTPLPEDYPAYSLLISNGFASVDSVLAATDEELLAVKGIGPAILEKIRGALG